MEPLLRVPSFFTDPLPYGPGKCRHSEVWEETFNNIMESASKMRGLCDSV